MLQTAGFEVEADVVESEAPPRQLSVVSAVLSARLGRS